VHACPAGLQSQTVSGRRRDLCMHDERMHKRGIQAFAHLAFELMARGGFRQPTS
jgi:hypothetical protein